MRNFTKIMLALALPIIGAAPVSARHFSPASKDLGRFAFKKTSHSFAFKGERQERINSINALLEGKKEIRKSNQIAPSMSLGPVDLFGDIDGPDNEIWYYVAKFDQKVIKHDTPDEHWTEHIMLEYTFDIYDEDMQPVGTVHDKVRYNDDEIRLVGCDLTPVVTRNFFNDDDKYEIIVSLSINSKQPGFNHYRSLIYSLGGEKETLSVEDVNNHGTYVQKEFDKPVTSIDAPIGNVLDASKNGVEEFYFTIYEDCEVEQMPAEPGEAGPGEDGSQAYWDMLRGSGIKVTVLGKADESGKFKEVLKYSFPNLSMPGDQEYSQFLITFNRNGESYILTQNYEKYFWNPFYAPYEDMTMREQNNLVIKLYKVDNYKATLVQTTNVPVVKDSSEAGATVIATFYSVGDLRYQQDISFGDFTQDGKASFYITKQNFTTASEDYEHSYIVCNPDGKKIKNVFTNADSSVGLADIEGFEPQRMFVSKVGNDYLFNMVDLISCKTKASFNYMLDTGNPDELDQMLANINRVKDGDSYSYVVELRYPTDEDDETYMRIAWLDKDGKFKFLDKINMGTDVFYAQSNLNASLLNPTVFHSDANREYMMLIKRGQADGTKTEDLLIAQAVNPDAPKGKELLLIKPSEKGAIANILTDTDGKPSVTVTFLNSSTSQFSIERYDLPLDGPNSSVNELESDGADSGIAYDGAALYAPGEVICIYNMQGAKVIQGSDSVSTSSLDAGVYIATAGGNTRKFIVK